MNDEITFCCEIVVIRPDKKMWNASRFCVSSLRRGHANLLCIVPILVYVQPKLVHCVLRQMLYIYKAMLLVTSHMRIVTFYSRNITIEPLTETTKTPIDGASSVVTHSHSPFVRFTVL